MKRCAPPASGPSRKCRPLTIILLPSMIGDDIRPPCVVHIPNFFGERALPQHLAVACDSDITRPLPLIAKTLPVAGSTTGDDQASRCAGTSLVNML